MGELKEYNNFTNFSNKFRFMNLLMTLAISVMHLSYWVSGDEDIVIQVIRLSSAGGMAWFFFTSAFWYFGNFTYENAVIKFKKRLSTLLIPYIVWNLLRFLYVYGIDIAKAGNLESHWKMLLEAFLFVNRGSYSYMPIIPGLWYIIRLFTYFLFAPVLYFLLKNKFIGAIVIVLTFLVTRNGGYLSFEGWICLFMIGAYISINFREEFIALFTKLKFGQKHKILGTIGLVGTYSLMIAIGIVIFKSGSGMWTGCHYLFGFLIAAIPVFLFHVIDLKQEVAAYSFVIYCSHTFWAPILNIVVDILNDYLPIAAGIHAILLLLAVVALSVVICKITQKYVPHVYCLLTGGR